MISGILLHSTADVKQKQVFHEGHTMVAWLQVGGDVDNAFAFAMSN